MFRKQKVLNTEKICLLILLVLTISIVALPTASAADEYNADDVAIFKQIYSHGTNWSSGLDLNDASTWGPYVTWSAAETDKRIEWLNISRVNFTGDLDVTGLTHLTSLNCNNNDLTSLNISGLTGLAYLYCDYTNLTSLDVSKNTELRGLYCYNNSLSSLDVTKNTELLYLHCRNNSLENLNVNENTELIVLNCSDNNGLTSLDVSKNTKLENLSCNNNTNLESLDLTGLTELMHLHCYNSNLTNLDVSQNTNLIVLFCNNNRLSSLDITKNTQLSDLYAEKQKISLPTSIASENQLTISNPIKYNGNMIADANINVVGSGSVNNGNITWTGLNGADGTASYGFAQSVGTGMAGSGFSGTVTQPWTANVQTDEYNASDVAAFKEIIDQLDRWRPVPDKNDISTWSSYVTWSDEPSNKRIVKLEIAHGGLTGDLDVTGLTELKELYCHNNSLSSLDVSKNTKLTYLNCYNNKITSLDVTGNPELIYLNCDMLDLKTLDVTQNTKLEELRCGETNITELDVTQNPELTFLSCPRNELISLDVTQNTKLIILWCSYNNLTSVNIIGLTDLTSLDLHINDLTNLDVTKNEKLLFLDLGGNNLTSLDISNNTKLTRLYCENNSLLGMDLTKNTELTELRAHGQNIVLSDAIVFGNQHTLSNPITFNGNQIADVNINVAGSGSINNGNIIWTGLSGESGISSFSFAQPTGIPGDTNTDFAGTVTQHWSAGVQTDEYNADDVAAFKEIIDQLNGWSSSLKKDDISTWSHVTWSDVPSNKRIVQLEIAHIGLTGDLDVTKLPELTELRCHNNSLSSLDVSKNTKLTHLNCYNNKITSLDVTGNPELTYLNCDMLDLKTLDVTKNTKLVELRCDETNLTSLDVKENTELVFLSCYRNNLTGLDVTQNTKLTYLDCYDNNLLSLNVIDLTELTELHCGLNELTSLDVSKNTKLKRLYCGPNNLNSLDVSELTELTHLSCYNNNLTNLDVTKNTKLVELHCQNNGLTNLDLTQNTELVGLVAYDQIISLPNAVASGNQLTISNPIRYNNFEVTNISVTGGTISDNNITWTELSDESGNAVFSFAHPAEYGVFSGTVTQPWTTDVPADEYTVTFNSMGGTSIQPQTVDSGNLVTQPANPVKDGYVFVEWQLNGVAYNFTTPVTSDLNLVAVYRVAGAPVIHTVTFNTNGGMGYTPSQKVNDGSLVTKPSNPFNFNGTFVEWQLNGIAYDFSTPVTSNMTLVAVYAPIHTVTFNSNGGMYTPSQKVNNGSLVIQPSNPYNFNGTFVEWQLNGSAYDFSTPVTSNITLVAVYAPIHTVTFNTNGGIGYTLSQKVNDGSLVNKPSNPFNFNGTFVEWQLSGAAYDFSTPVTSNIALVAVYR